MSEIVYFTFVGIIGTIWAILAYVRHSADKNKTHDFFEV